MTVTDDRELKRILQESRTVASVGVSSSRDKPGYWIFHYLKGHGYRMIPVNPTASEIQGLKSFPDLPSLPLRPDVVQIFRKSADVPPIVEHAIQIRAKVVWMQKGIINEEAAARAEAAGLQVVMDRCMMETHQRLLGESFRI